MAWDGVLNPPRALSNPRGFVVRRPVLPGPCGPDNRWDERGLRAAAAAALRGADEQADRGLIDGARDGTDLDASAVGDAILEALHLLQATGLGLARRERLAAALLQAVLTRRSVGRAADGAADVCRARTRAAFAGRHARLTVGLA